MKIAVVSWTSFRLTRPVAMVEAGALAQCRGAARNTRVDGAAYLPEGHTGRVCRLVGGQHPVLTAIAYLSSILEEI